MNSFEKLVSSVLKKLGYVYRFPDSAMYPQGVRKLSPPSDFLFIREGQTYFIECKSVKGKRFPLKNITQNQWRSAAGIEREGGRYYFVIKIGDEIFAVPYAKLKEINKKGVYQKDLEAFRVME